MYDVIMGRQRSATPVFNCAAMFTCWLKCCLNVWSLVEQAEVQDRTSDVGYCLKFVLCGSV